MNVTSYISHNQNELGDELGDDDKVMIAVTAKSISLCVNLN